MKIGSHVRLRSNGAHFVVVDMCDPNWVKVQSMTSAYSDVITMRDFAIRYEVMVRKYTGIGSGQFNSDVYVAEVAS